MSNARNRTPGRGAKKKARMALLAMLPVVAAAPDANAALGQIFYSHETENWQITGDTGNSNTGPACSLIQYYRDGSSFGLYADIQSGDLFIILINNAWNIRGNRGDRLDVDYYFYTPRTVYDSLFGYTVLFDYNSILIPDINGATFLDPFYYATYMEIVMPGNIPAVTVSLIGTAEGLVYLNECVETATGRRTQTQQPQVQPLQPRPRN